MNYLSKKSFVHRDLAARNIFLDENYICKVSKNITERIENDFIYIYLLVCTLK